MLIFSICPRLMSISASIRGRALARKVGLVKKVLPGYNAPVKAILLCVGMAFQGWAALPQKPAGTRVADLAGALSVDGENQLKQLSDDLEKANGAELAVAVVADLDGSDVADFTNKLFRAWGVGKKGRDNGILIVLCPKERKARVEVGYGLEGTLPDALAGRVLKEDMRPYFADKKWEQGLLVGAKKLADYAKASPALPVKPGANPADEAPPAALFLGAALLSLLVFAFSFLVGAGAGARSWGLAVMGGVFVPPLFIIAATANPKALMAMGPAALLAALWGFRQGRADPKGWSAGTGGSSSSGSGFSGYSGSSGGSYSSSSSSSSSSDFGGGSSGGGGASDSF